MPRPIRLAPRPTARVGPTIRDELVLPANPLYIVGPTLAVGLGVA